MQCVELPRRSRDLDALPLEMRDRGQRYLRYRLRRGNRRTSNVSLTTLPTAQLLTKFTFAPAAFTGLPVHQLLPEDDRRFPPQVRYLRLSQDLRT